LIWPTIREVSYKELKSGKIVIGERAVKVSPLSSLKKAEDICETLKRWIEEASFQLSAPVERLPTETVFNPMKQTKDVPFVENIVHEAVTCSEEEKIEESGPAADRARSGYGRPAPAPSRIAIISAPSSLSSASAVTPGCPILPFFARSKAAMRDQREANSSRLSAPPVMMSLA